MLAAFKTRFLKPSCVVYWATNLTGSPGCDTSTSEISTVEICANSGCARRYFSFSKRIFFCHTRRQPERAG